MFYDNYMKEIAIEDEKRAQRLGKEKREQERRANAFKYKKETELEYILGLIKRGVVNSLDEVSEILIKKHPQDILLAIMCNYVKFKSCSDNYISFETKCDLADVLSEFNGNKKFMLNAIICGFTLARLFPKADSELLNDRNFVLDAIKRGAKPIPKKYENDREIIKAYIKYDGMRLKDLSDTYKNDINFIKIALKYNWRIVTHLDKKWIDDVDFIKYLVSIHPDFLRYASEKVLNMISEELTHDNT
ncbi:MAG: DUF4116 domain-containing protein [Marivivens sp.]|nr:DUF4116 domain-containing protein [Marivivens sp.]NBT51698.1 DUF4116 domain-containing protein [Marivivens sp.]NCW68604.1 DUF4116 domain-containing protein [Marivivens sp.]